MCMHHSRGDDLLCLHGETKTRQTLLNDVSVKHTVDYWTTTYHSGTHSDMEDVTQAQWDTNPNPAPSLNIYIYYLLSYKVPKLKDEGNYCMCKLRNRNKMQRCLILKQLPGNWHTNPVCLSLMELLKKPHSLHYSIDRFILSITSC